MNLIEHSLTLLGTPGADIFFIIGCPPEDEGVLGLWVLGEYLYPPADSPLVAEEEEELFPVGVRGIEASMGLSGDRDEEEGCPRVCCCC